MGGQQIFERPKIFVVFKTLLGVYIDENHDVVLYEVHWAGADNFGISKHTPLFIAAPLYI